MQFRLIYDGELLGASRNSTRAEHKHDIRRVFHKQLKRLWSINPHLTVMATNPPMKNMSYVEGVGTYPEFIGKKFAVGPYQCVPLVTEDLALACGLEILFLRYDQPGATLIQSGDIDNRLKTLFDALRRPQNTAECYGEPTADEQPLFCLLEDDKFIDHVAITTDLLLEPHRNVNDVHLVIEVKIKAMAASVVTLGFI